MGRIGPVHAHHPTGRGQALLESGDGNPRCVRGENATPGHQAGNLRQNRALEVDLLGHVLDDKIGTGDGILKDVRQRDITRRTPCGNAEIVEHTGDGRQFQACCLDGPGIHIMAPDGHAGTRQHRGNAGAHGAQTNDGGNAHARLRARHERWQGIGAGII